VISMRSVWFSLPVLLSGCWPYIPVAPTAAELAGTNDTGDDPVDTTDTTTGDDTTDWTSLCAPGPDKLGPWPKHPISKAGVGTQKKNYSIDVGVDDVLDAALSTTTPKTVSLTISGAIVSAVGPVSAGKATLWASDENGTVVLFNLPIDDSTVRPGDRVKVQVTRVVGVDGVPEVTGGSIKVTAEGQSVWVEQLMNGKSLSFDDWPEAEVEVWGELSTKPTDCGAGFDCFDLDHGAKKPVSFRVQHGQARFGDCVHVIAPLNQFDGAPELVMIDPDWFQTY